ncbi:hypothetical protein THASP1DRAFT_29913 [Thamnocephalis sphaerospora]|uniref:J domain-containing protein n=1 Tax=Thamnocephalis sphaerospora TaxID=78915 RepID=A0A4P9XSF3_9FUNG|nr:hypothetical protein THASP1DRAFT_29913 [Thamnocephalis sphaerospora]|eukprot:RKP08280.1 hypothetical protein THASP1DRAFT_29913 [Thamnocephalis sphaerospora]
MDPDTPLPIPGEPAGPHYGPDDDLDVDLRALEDALTPPETDYYGVLNLSKTASEEEIKDAYRRLCRLFHPDKHSGAPELKRAAEERFQIIQRAYEVLADPRRRALFDQFGEEGLTLGQEIGQRYKTPEEMREEFRKLHKKQMELEVENMVKSKGEVEVNINASPLFLPYSEPQSTYSPIGFPVMGGAGVGPPPPQLSRFEKLSRAASKVQVLQLTLKHSYELPVTPKTSLVMTGHMISRDGLGGGNLLGTVRHMYSATAWGEVGASLLQPRHINAKIVKNLSPDSFAQVHASARTLSAPPSLSITAGRRIGKQTTGYMTYRTGEWNLGPWGRDDVDIRAYQIGASSVALGLQAQNKNGGGHTVELQTGLSESHAVAEYTRKVRDGAKLRFSLTLSTNAGVSASVGGDARVTDHTKLGLSVECALAGGVTLRLRASRFGQRVTVPLLLSPYFYPRIAFFSCLIPGLSVYALDKLYLHPRRLKARSEKVAAMREEHAAYLAERKRDAENAIRLMEASVHRRADQEKACGGLVIVEAHYGAKKQLDNVWRKLKQSAIGGATAQQAAADDEQHWSILRNSEDIISVTTAIQALVYDSKLLLAGGHSKIHTPGFYDPCFGERKKLLVLYRFRDQLHVICVEDTAPLACPLRSHALHQ